MDEVTIPNNWAARPHQIPFMEARLVQDVKRMLCVWHRRAGKDSASINLTCIEAHKHIATYWHMLPTAIQARHVVWDAINPATGVRMIDQAFPERIRAGINNTEMKIELKNGSFWQCVGSDNYDRLVGASPLGVVFSEWSLTNPAAWDYIRPILKENGGWATFIYTFRGKNHGWDLYKMAKKNPRWFCELLDIEHTWRDAEMSQPVITQQDYQEEIDDGMDPLLALQEYYCSADAGLSGAYWTEALKKSKVGDYPWDPMKPVHTFWDIGLDTTAIWFAQEADNGLINVIDYWSGANVGLSEWIKRMKDAPYSYGQHVGPHDIKRREFWTAMGYNTLAAQLMDFEFEECPNISRKEGIDAVKMFLPRLRFNRETTTTGWDALTNYRREYNEKLRLWLNTPLHDWASHGADAMRYFAIAWPENFGGIISSRFTVKKAIGQTHAPTQQDKMNRMISQIPTVEG
jgi:phage terminase large subunit